MKTNTLLPLLFSLLIAAITTYSVRWCFYYVERRYITLYVTLDCDCHRRKLCVCVCVCVFLLCFQLPSVRPHFVIQSSPVQSSPIQFVLQAIRYIGYLLRYHFIVALCNLYTSRSVPTQTQNNSSGREEFMMYRQSILQRFFLFFFFLSSVP